MKHREGKVRQDPPCTRLAHRDLLPLGPFIFIVGHTLPLECKHTRSFCVISTSQSRTITPGLLGSKKDSTPFE